MTSRLTPTVAAVATLFLAACGGQQANQANVESAGIGAATYTPSVYVEPGSEGRYQRVLAICRQAAANRQLTAAQTEALRTEGVLTEEIFSGTTEIVSEQLVTGDVSDASGFDFFGGLLTSAMAEDQRAAQSTAAKTRSALLECLRAADKFEDHWTVLE